MTIDFTPSKKQDEVFELFKDKTTTEILFGGGVGSAKSYLLAAIAIIYCLLNKGIRVGLARNELTTLKKTTVVTFFEVFGNWGLEKDTHYNYNSIEGSITFFNGSTIVFQELRYLPGDPDYTRLGGLLLTFGLIDEAGECEEKGKEIFQSRCGRWLNDEHNIKPMLLMTCNPSRNFLFKDFFQAVKEGTISKHRAFVNATVYDNPFISSQYIDNLKQILSYNEIQRLLNGDWEYDGDPNSLLNFEDIKNLYDTTIQQENPNTRYISADIAFTSDNCVVLVWEGYHIIEVVTLKKESNIEDEIKALASKHGVNVNKIAYDSDGVGKYLMNYLKLAKPIVNNAKPYKKENYKNLKTQLYFKMCELIIEGKIKILDSRNQKEIMEELGSVKHKPRDTADGKIEMNSKADVKRLIGRSPDYSDAIAYRMIFELTSVANYNFN